MIDIDELQSQEIGYANRTWSDISRECLAQAIGDGPACYGCYLIPQDLVSQCKVWDAVQWLKENKPEGLSVFNQDKANRDSILEVIKENPGSTFTDIHRMVGISGSEKAKAYFRDLIDEKLIVSVKKWKYKYWYPV